MKFWILKKTEIGQTQAYLVAAENAEQARGVMALWMDERRASGATWEDSELTSCEELALPENASVLNLLDVLD